MYTLSDIPRSAIIVLDHVSEEGPVPAKEISKKTSLPLRTVSFALAKLRKIKLLRRRANFMDMRRPLYTVNHERLRELEAHIDTLRVQAGLMRPM